MSIPHIAHTLQFEMQRQLNSTHSTIDNGNVNCSRLQLINNKIGYSTIFPVVERK